MDELPAMAAMLDEIVRAFARYTAMYGEGPARVVSASPIVSTTQSAHVRLTLVDGEQYMLALIHATRMED